MLKSIRKFTSVIIAVAMVSALASFCVTANASELGKVRVIICNDVFPVEDGAAWEGTLVDEWVSIDEESTVMSAVVTALNNHDYTQTGAEYNYITEVNGLSAFDASEMSGWMGTLNDWFTNEGFGAFTVADGTLEDGDEIAIMYTDMWGLDIGSDWSSNDTVLAYAEFSTGTLNEEFDCETTDYTLTVPADTTSISVLPTAFNKNYQVRTYKNEYTPDEKGYKRNAEISVEDGDIIYIGVGDESWPSMNYSAGATVYSFTIKLESKEQVAGDVNLDGNVDIDDVTLLQQYLAGISELNLNQLEVADYNNDNNVSILDATYIQKIIAGFYE